MLQYTLCGLTGQKFRAQQDKIEDKVMQCVYSICKMCRYSMKSLTHSICTVCMYLFMFCMYVASCGAGVQKDRQDKVYQHIVGRLSCMYSAVGDDGRLPESDGGKVSE